MIVEMYRKMNSHVDMVGSLLTRALWGEISGTKAQRLSLIAVLNGSQLLASMRFEDYCDTTVFHAGLEQALVPDVCLG